MQALNAYEFERHANCKTKHPNNHIYFENGKTIYAVVQELKNTPQEMLFDAIQTVTGCPINQKNFRSWKGNVLIRYLIQLLVTNGIDKYMNMLSHKLFLPPFFLLASYQAATRELQRIYGKDEVAIPS